MKGFTFVLDIFLVAIKDLHINFQLQTVHVISCGGVCAFGWKLAPHFEESRLEISLQALTGKRNRF